jgi:hypothetical protein
MYPASCSFCGTKLQKARKTASRLLSLRERTFRIQWTGGQAGHGASLDAVEYRQDSVLAILHGATYFCVLLI